MDPTTIELGGYQPPASVHNQAAEVFGKELSARLGDAIDYKMDGNMVASRGIKAIDLPVMVDRGELNMCYFASSYLADEVPEVAIFDLPFVVESREKAYRALDGELGDYLTKKFRENTGIRVLGFWDNGFRHFTNGLHPIEKPADCEGLKIRTMNSVMHQTVFKKLGFEPTFVDVKDLVEAAKTGTIDAQENPLTNTYNFGTFQHHPYITLSGHFFGMAIFMVHNDTFESWPENVQKAVVEAAAIATQAQRGLASAEDAAIMAKLDDEDCQVTQLTDAQRQAFVDAVSSVVDDHQDTLGGVLKMLQG